MAVPDLVCDVKSLLTYLNRRPGFRLTARAGAMLVRGLVKDVPRTIYISVE